MSEKEEKTSGEKNSFLDENKLEIITVILLGITALLTAWASYVGSIHGGNQATNYATSNNLSSEGNSLYNSAIQTLTQDMDVWNTIMNYEIEIMYADETNDQKALEAKTWGYRFWMTVACSLILILICIMVVAHLRSTIRRYELEKRLRSAAVVIRLKEQARHNPPESPTFQDWKDLRSLVHKEIPSFYYSLNTEDYTLTDMEYDVCLLRRVHMTPTEIYKLKKCSSSYVSTLRIRLLYRVFGKRGTPNDFDDLLFAIR